MVNLITYVVLLVVVALSCVNVKGSPGGQWDTVGKSGVSAMHALLSPTTNKVIFIDKWQTPAFIKIDGIEAMSSEYDMDTNDFRPLRVFTNTFCSAGGYLPNGTMVSLGGANSDKFKKVEPGYTSIRFMRPCAGTDCTWDMLDNVTISAPRWYPSVEALSDGTLMIVGGSRKSTQINHANISTASFELYPPRAGIKNPTPLAFLLKTETAGLYPIVILLPNGNIFLFSNVNAVIMSSDTFKVITELPAIPGGPRSYPFTGSGILLPLDPQNSYTAEVLICGGAESRGPNLNSSVPLRSCGRINPLSPNPVWEQDNMPSIRVMPDLLHMSDGNVLVVNGAMAGAAGWNLARKPNYVPFFYNKDVAVGQRWTTGTSTEIARMYHSVAMTVPDGRVLVAGSNPNEFPNMTAQFPSEFRVEMFTPPFLLKGIARPVILAAPESIKYGAKFTISVTTYQRGSTVRVSMAQSGFVTHSTHMSQRYVFLNSTTSSGPGMFTVWGPPSGNIMPPSFYMLRVIENGVPSTAVWVQVTN